MSRTSITRNGIAALLSAGMFLILSYPFYEELSGRSKMQSADRHQAEMVVGELEKLRQQPAPEMQGLTTEERLLKLKAQVQALDRGGRKADISRLERDLNRAVEQSHGPSLPRWAIGLMLGMAGALFLLSLRSFLEARKGDSPKSAT